MLDRMRDLKNLQKDAEERAGKLFAAIEDLKPVFEVTKILHEKTHSMQKESNTRMLELKQAIEANTAALRAKE